MHRGVKEGLATFTSILRYRHTDDLELENDKIIPDADRVITSSTPHFDLCRVV